MKNHIVQSLAFVVVISFNHLTQVHAWGLRGHGLICEASTYLVDDKGFSEFLKYRIPTLTYLCNIPDIHWRGLAPEQTQKGNPTHYLNPEVLGLQLNTLPLDWKELQQKYQGTEDRANPGKKIIDLHRSLGSIWWRAEDLALISIEHFKKVSMSPPPAHRGEEQSDLLTYNQSLFQALTTMGVLGHFLGDASMPFHTTIDYDGYQRGHGGIHGFFEEESIAWLDEKTLVKVIDEARLILKTERKKKKNFLERIRDLTVISNKDQDLILALDPIEKKSELKSDKGLEIKVPAIRKKMSPKALKKWQALQVKHLARAAAFLTLYWDEIYQQSGKPDLKPYRHFRFPHSADFIEPRYLIKPEATK